MTFRKSNAICLSAVILLALLSVLLFSLPVYRFDANVYTKRSGNTFVGDERYLAARREVDAQMADYAARGIHTEITEEIIERVNSKGETTSLIVFRVNRETDCSGWDFIRSGFPSGKVLLLFLALPALAGCLSSSPLAVTSWTVDYAGSKTSADGAKYGVARLLLVAVRSPYAGSPVAVLRADGYECEYYRKD